jgi:hypothetical protein
MCFVEQIINLIPKWLHVFIQNRGTYKNKNNMNCIFFKMKWCTVNEVEMKKNIITQMPMKYWDFQVK